MFDKVLNTPLQYIKSFVQVIVHVFPTLWAITYVELEHLTFNLQLHRKVFSYTERSNTLYLLPTNCLSVFDHFVGLTLKGLKALEQRPLMFQSTFTCSKSTMKAPEQYEICSRLRIKTSERCHGRRSGVFIVNFQQILNTVLGFPLVTLN